jgi:hypothetical protein
MVIELASTISANAEEVLEDELVVEVDEPPPPSPPAVLAAPVAPPAEPLELDPVPDPEPLLVELLEPADTESPVVRLLSETIVPVAGA